jgi:predicted RNase H-like HicB family nuclease/DNA-binding XRE family transcriptional regulator
MAGAIDPNALTPEELAAARPYPLLIEWSREDEAFIVSVPDMPGVRTHGATREEAAEMGDEVVAIVLGHLQAAGRPIPSPSPYSGNEPEDQTLPFSAERVRSIRRSFNVSQEEFARLLNVSVSTVRAWEHGVWPPAGAAARLLSIAERHPETIHEAASSTGVRAEMVAARAS